MSGDASGVYDDRHRAFLQAFMSRSTLTLEEAKPVLAAIWTAQEHREIPSTEVSEDDFHDYINRINDAISSFDMEIRSTPHQQTRTRVYALVNSASDPVTQLATHYSPDEIAFVKRVLDAIFESNNTSRRELMAITSMDAVRLNKVPTNRRRTQNGSETQGSSGEGILMVQAEKVLKGLVDQGWFEKSPRGYLSLSPRALMELRGWLLDTYNDDVDEGDDEPASRHTKVKLCFACREIITTGQRCPRRTCDCRLHDICTQSFFTVQRNRQCPMCTTEWTGEDFVGERAVAASSNRASTGHGRTSTGGGSHGPADDSDTGAESDSRD